MSEDHLPAFVGNGAIGLRVRPIPLTPGIATVSGLEGEHPEARVPAAPHAPYPLAGDVRLGDVWLSDAPHCIRFLEQEYDFDCGELRTRFQFVVGRLEATVEILTFCSRSQPSLVAQEVVVHTNRATDVALVVGIDPRRIAGTWAERSPRIPGTDDESIDGCLLWQTLGGLSTCGAAYTTEFRGDVDVRRSCSEEEHQPLRTSYEFHVARGTRVALRQIAALVPSALHSQPHRQATRHVALGKAIGFDALRAENRREWEDLWRGRIVLVGADARWQGYVDAAFFYLQSSAHRSSFASTHPFALAQWGNYHYYYGHVMWDIEAFVSPFLLLTQPGAAKAILDYRSERVTAARHNAKLNGYQGIQFPWESSARTGEEASPGLGTASAYEHHVGLDVAVAFAQYAHATGDARFRRDQAWPVLSGVADWVASRAIETSRGWEIRGVMGIAERKEPSDNVAFVNMSAIVALREAIACGRQLGRPIPPEWHSLAAELVIPIDSASGVIQDHDGYDPNEEKGATPAVLAGLFPLGYEVSPEVEAATTDFYLNLSDAYIGSPMLSALYGVWAARRGRRSEAAQFFEEGYAKFVSSRFTNTHEYRTDKFPEQPVAGPFSANMGGLLLGCLYGLTGIRIGPGTPPSWCQRPVTMPEGWSGIDVERIWVRGKPATLSARHGESAATISMHDE
ncbi:MAG TPA: glycoside hydrolase family 65 protein [Acidimicrobiia bacterium]|nr:glycoside hydrolase family 65 protein [Acidimicrobiia bacterium]